MKLIEIFMWQYEGEYEQYFFVTENEKQFIKDMIMYLNDIQSKKEFPWSSVLSDFQEDNQIEGYFLIGHVAHLKETYFLDFDYQNFFSVEKRSITFNKEQIK